MHKYETLKREYMMQQFIKQSDQCFRANKSCVVFVTPSRWLIHKVFSKPSHISYPHNSFALFVTYYGS